MGENNIEGDEKTVVASEMFTPTLHAQLEAAAKEKKLARFMWVAKKNLHVGFQSPGYQEDWVMGVECANGHREQLLTATFKARRLSWTSTTHQSSPRSTPIALRIIFCLERRCRGEVELS